MDVIVIASPHRRQRPLHYGEASLPARLLTNFPQNNCVPLAKRLSPSRNHGKFIDKDFTLINSRQLTTTISSQHSFSANDIALWPYATQSIMDAYIDRWDHGDVE